MLKQYVATQIKKIDKITAENCVLIEKSDYTDKFIGLIDKEHYLFSRFIMHNLRRNKSSSRRLRDDNNGDDNFVLESVILVVVVELLLLLLVVVVEVVIVKIIVIIVQDKPCKNGKNT